MTLIETETALEAVVMQRQDSPAVSPIHYSLDEAQAVASLFKVPPPLAVDDFQFKGNINQHTFSVIAADGSEYLLQRINHEVFTKPENTMRAMMASIHAQNQALSRNPPVNGDEWIPIRLIPTCVGDPYLRHDDHHGRTVWRLMERIPDCATYKSLSELPANRRLHFAEEAGRGLARYLRFTAEVPTTGLASPLPGYRDTALYHNQLLSVLAGSRTVEDADPFLPTDPAVRHSTADHFRIHLDPAGYAHRMREPELQPFIALARECRDYALTLQRELAGGSIRECAIHGDTKLENFLFCNRTDRAKALVDLDTIMPHTWLSDWGDMVRSLVNVAGERETDPDKIRVDMAIYESLARGFMRTFGRIDPTERDLMVDSVQIIALELGIRFLSDYLRGDSYFLIGPDDPPELNRTRAMVQLTLFQRLKAVESEARRLIERYAAS